MPSIANRVAHLGTTIFTEINELALKHNALNLGQGRPDFDPPLALIAQLTSAVQGTNGAAPLAVTHQYAPGNGAPPLRKAIADHAGRFYNLDIDPDRGVVVTAGATEGIFAALVGLVDRGDEVIIIEPFFDSYVPNVEWLGATPVFVPMRPPDWTLDPDELRRAFTPKTKAILLNTPHNPTGRVFSRAELQCIADLCIEHDVVAISDEVYEHLTFGGAPHVPMASLPGMHERTVTVSSLGKSFSVTGWKIGWVYGHPNMMIGVSRAHQFITFAVNHPGQAAAAAALSLPGTYFEDFQAMYAAKRDLMIGGLRAAGLRVNTPEGTYFAMADFSAVFDGDDLEFARYLTSEIGVACIPPTAFYSQEHAYMASTQARFAFCKSDDTLRQAAERLARLNG
ncbi:MAG: aminotransferase class I/II-fold pyridoxal phosphate-dependent enzyme [bacterium]|nr:aminotransferase class I/II-fold pyridoxal phosphate-dependent enzyme [bacterium]